MWRSRSEERAWYTSLSEEGATLLMISRVETNTLLSWSNDFALGEGFSSSDFLHRALVVERCGTSATTVARSEPLTALPRSAR